MDVMLRVDVTRDRSFESFEVWKDAVLVFYSKESENESRILDRDIVTLWGGLSGSRPKQQSSAIP
jgi:hypothetical protein